MLSASWNFEKLYNIFRSFNAKNLGSVGQRVAKLQALKVGDLKKKSAIRPRPHSNHSARIQIRPRLNHSQSLMAGNFAALSTAAPKFLALKDLNLFSTVVKVQEADSIFKVGFALSKWPHLHRAYLVTIYNQNFIAVSKLSLCVLIFKTTYTAMKLRWHTVIK